LATTDQRAEPRSARSPAIRTGLSLSSESHSDVPDEHDSSSNR
jgi:hypothetical protein